MNSESEVAQVKRELREALEQQTATSEVLQVISSSLGELQPVFEAMLEKAVRICDAKFGNIYRWDGELLHLVAAHSTPPALAAARRRSAMRPTWNIGHMVATKAVIHVADLAANQAYSEHDPTSVAAVELGGVRTYVAVPMLKENELIGSFSLYRQEVRPFTDKQIELVTGFAAQAVIAIENARLLTELRQRTADLVESLEHQTATSEILASISGSMTDSKPVFGAIVRSVLRLFGTRYAVVQLLQDDMIHIAAIDGEAGFEKLADRYPRALDDSTAGGRAMLSKQVMQFASGGGDSQADPTAHAQFARDFGFNSTICAPMLRGDKVIGAIVTARRDAQAFTDKQASLIKAFADQAVIAIENARLFNELRQRTTDLTESLEQQTATSEVLQVISSSPGDLQPVFASILENATRICQAKFGILVLPEGDAFRVVATHNAPEAFVDMRRREPVFHPGPLTPVTRVAAMKQLLHIPDLAEDVAYKEHDPTVTRFVDSAGVRTLVLIPMVKENRFIGAIAIFRQEVRPFTDKQIALATSFAAQAVIAIENTRLLSELREVTGAADGYCRCAACHCEFSNRY